ncbi:hypothetical protein [Microbacterium murale]|uniref:hypothetical protein n=1 Tax=Microbacterium murale TaxID=1081040 RepID=UPI0027D8AEED|nr:hypothetical protein [Microbacterium murale]
MGIVAIVLVAAFNGPRGSVVPQAFILAVGGLLAMMVVRCGALTLVRAGNGWARWIYIGAVIVGTVSLLGSPLPILYLLLIVAVVSTILIFRKPVNVWLRQRAAARTSPESPNV